MIIEVNYLKHTSYFRLTNQTHQTRKPGKNQKKLAPLLFQASNNTNNYYYTLWKTNKWQDLVFIVMVVCTFVQQQTNIQQHKSTKQQPCCCLVDLLVYVVYCVVVYCLLMCVFLGMGKMGNPSSGRCKFCHGSGKFGHGAKVLCVDWRLWCSVVVCVLDFGVEYPSAMQWWCSVTQVFFLCWACSSKEISNQFTWCQK